jgi:NitT/TauT family transport system ATP-binding protein
MAPTSGAVVLREEPVMGPISDFGIVFQSPVLLPWRSALRNVLLPIEMLGRSGYEDRAKELLAQVGLTEFRNHRPSQLSGGMKQRVSLCRALIHDPSILLMDEPFGAIDEFTRESLNDQLLELWRDSNKTVLFVTHNVGEAVYLSDRVAVMSGRPSRLADVIEIDLPRERHAEMRYETRFIEQVKKVHQALRAG